MVGFLGTGNRNSPATDNRHPDTLAQHNANESAACPDSSPSRSQSSGHQNDISHRPLHFFSLPHWTRKMLPPSVSARRSRAAMPSDELGVIPRSPSKLMLDKELPPMPPTTQSVTGSLGSVATSLDPAISPPTPSHKPTPSPIVPGAIPSTSTESRNTQPTMYFDLYHNTPYISFVTPSPTDIDQRDSTLPLRQSKSSHSFRAHRQACESTQPLDGANRARGLSTGQRPSSSKRPGQNYAEPLPIPGKSEASPVRQILKKPSQQLLSVPSDSFSLPALQPTSPFHIDFQSDTLTSSQQSPQRSASRLTRSHSERFFRRLSHSNGDAPALPKIPSAFTPSQFPSTAVDPPRSPRSPHSPRPTLRRPATADSTRSRTRTRSFFTLSTQTSPTPSNHTPHFGNALSSLTSPTSINHTNTRPRSATNPPLLHRLSLNFFASSTSPAKFGTVLDSSVTGSPVSRSRPSMLSSVPPEDLRPHQDELPESFLHRLTSLVGKGDIAGLLASRYIISFSRFSLF